MQAGYDPDYYFIEDRASDVPYYNYYNRRGRGAEESNFTLKTAMRVLHPRDHRGERRRPRTATRLRVAPVCFPAEIKTDVYNLYHSLTPKIARLWEVSKR